jgi:hypothetical protein
LPGSAQQGVFVMTDSRGLAARTRVETAMWPDQPISAAAPAPGVGTLLARCGAWLRCMNHAAALREIDPRMARDIGVSLPADRGPEGFAIDPRPLWGIGLTPLPMDTLPPWSRRRGS